MTTRLAGALLAIGVLSGCGGSAVPATPAAVAGSAGARNVVKIGSGIVRAASVALADDGTLYVAAENAIDKVAQDGTVTTLVSHIASADVVAVDAENTVYFIDGDAVKSIDVTGKIARIAGGFKSPKGVAVDGAGNVYVSDLGSASVKEFAPDGSVKTIGLFFGISAFKGPTGLWVDRHCAQRCDLYVADFIYGGAVVIYGSGGYAKTPVCCDLPLNVAVDASGNVYLSDQDPGSVRVIAPNGMVSQPYQYRHPIRGVAVDGRCAMNCAIYFVPYNDGIGKIEP